MIEGAPRLYDYIMTDGVADVLVSVSRQPGLNEDGEPLQEMRAGNMLPRLCEFAGQGACKATCQAPEDYANEAKDCAIQNGRQLFEVAGIPIEDVRLGKVCGGATVAFTDRDQPELNSEGYYWYPDVDAVVGTSETVKACRLADCGLLVVTGLTREGIPFDGFIHATRNNLNGNDQFTGHDGNPVGGVTKMLNEIQMRYAPFNMSVELVAGIAPELYLFDFTPNAKDLQANPQMTADSKRESLFKGWYEQGWIVPHIVEGQEWDGKTYQVDMSAAIRDQVAAAGLGLFYKERVLVDGNLASGHASNRGGKAGTIQESRDFYAVIPYAYDNFGA